MGRVGGTWTGLGGTGKNAGGGSFPHRRGQGGHFPFTFAVKGHKGF